MDIRKIAPLAALAICLMVPILPGIPSFWITLLNYIGIFCLVSIGLVVLTGVAGVMSFGQAMFVGVGAYTSAYLSMQHNFSPWIGLMAAIAVGGAFAWVVGIITLKLSGHYLALATIAWNVSFFYLFGAMDVFGRYDGMAGIPPITIAGFSLLEGSRVYYVIWAFVALAVLCTGNLLNSRIGRAIRALKGGAVAAESFGIRTSDARLIAFVYAAILSVIAGWLYAHMQRAINPSAFGLNTSIEFLLMAVVGGVGSIWGAILGAGLVSILKDVLQDILPKFISVGGNVEIIVFGAILILILQIAPTGLWPLLTRRWQRRRMDENRGDRATLKSGGELVQLSRDGLGSGSGLHVQAVTKRFGGLVAVNGVDFKVGAKEIIGLIGPNGAGKSTLFNLVTGLLPLSGGSVHFQGGLISGKPSREIATLGIARTFQHVKLAPEMSVIENVALGAHLRSQSGALRAMLRLDRAEEAKIFAEARRNLERVGLGAYAQRPAGSLALGQQRIIEIARALCLHPSLLLLDEPAAGLRHLEKVALADLLRQLRAEGLSILLVEHDMEFVMGLADRLVVINFGEKLVEGQPSTVRANPAVIEAYLGGA